MVEPAVEYLNFPKEEEKILEFWKEINVFQECLKQSKGKPRYFSWSHLYTRYLNNYYVKGLHFTMDHHLLRAFLIMVTF